MVRIAAVFFLYLSCAVYSQEFFSEDATALGLAFDNTDTQSVAWLDFNGDGWQDLWLAGHQMDSHFFRSRLYINDKGRSFSNVWPTLHTSSFRTDAHGSYWADYDNDGDQDLLVVAGGGVGRDKIGSPNYLFENRQGTLVDRAAGYGMDNLAARGRIGFWLDQDSDGKLDIMLLNSPRPDNRPSSNQLLHQRESGFEPSDLTPTRSQSIGGKQLILAPGGIPASVGLSLDTDTGPSGLVLAPFPRRVVQADLDGDSKMDYLVYAPAKMQGNTCYALSPKGALLAYLPAPRDGQSAYFEFTATGPVKLNSRWLKQFSSWQGNTRISPEFTSQHLSSFDTHYHRLAADQVAVSKGIQVSWLTDRNTWRIDVHQLAKAASTLQFVLTPAASGVALETTETPCEPKSPFPAYVVSGSDQLRRPFAYTGLQEELSARGIVAGDFDNDTDLDLYVSRGTPVQDLADVLLINDGNGNFVARPVAAANSYSELGVYVDEIVPGPHIAVADYNNDGYLDIFQAASYYYAWLDSPRLAAGVPNRLLTNLGNDNHWLELNLQGSRSNRDGIGATVKLYAGGKEQLRYQTGGVDSFDQHSKILHFGLGESDVVDRIEIAWPSGETSVVSNTAGDQILSIEEVANQSPQLELPLRLQGVPLLQ